MIMMNICQVSFQVVLGIGHHRFACKKVFSFLIALILKQTILLLNCYMADEY